MNMKATVLTIALTASVLVGAILLYTHNADNNANGGTSSSNQTASNTAAAPPVPWPVPPSGNDAPANSPTDIQKTTQNSVLVPPPPYTAPSTALSGSVAERPALTPDGQPLTTAQLVPMAPATQVVPVPIGTPRAQVVRVPVRSRSYVVRRVTIRKRYHSGKVHVGKAVKHLVLFSAKLPFKLRP